MSTKKEFKVFSHAQRMLDDARITRNFINGQYPSTEEQIVRDTALDNGTKVVKSVVKTVKVADKFKGLRWYDFGVETLEYTGAIANLKPSVLQQNTLAQADSLSVASQKLESVINNNKTK